jgi:hypothetical protein
MENELDNLFIDIKSDKPLKRNKAFGRFLHLLNTQLEDVQKIVENSDTNWNEFFKAAHQGAFILINFISIFCC